MNSAFLCVFAREIKALKGFNIYNVRHRRIIENRRYNHEKTTSYNIAAYALCNVFRTE